MVYIVHSHDNVTGLEHYCSCFDSFDWAERFILKMLGCKSKSDCGLHFKQYRRGLSSLIYYYQKENCSRCYSIIEQEPNSDVGYFKL
jgi:hypothetical protein